MRIRWWCRHGRTGQAAARFVVEYLAELAAGMDNEPVGGFVLKPLPWGRTPIGRELWP